MTDLFKRYGLLWLAVAAVMAGGWYGWGPSETPEPELAAAAPGDPGARDSGEAAAPPSATVMVSDAMGAKLDAARLFELGFSGGLVIDRDTRASVEALMNSLPENLSEADLANLERTLREGLPREDAEKALKLFLDYRAYTRDIREEMQPKGMPNSLEEAHVFFDQMDAVKRRHFDEATAAALFGADDTLARITMEAMFVRQDTSLSPEQKKAQLDALRARLPAEQKALVPDDAASQPAG
ncbi:lipase secretion chaperone [Sphaerotilaceae bacterium SBD11-9]